jgi:rhomboid family protein
MRPYYYNNNVNPPPPPQGPQGLFASLPPITAWLLKINIGIFLVFWLLGKGPLYSLLSLSLDGIQHGFIWQPVTYMFLHASFTHILFNMFTLFFLGPETERAMGSRHFLAMYMLSGIVGGLGWLWLSAAPMDACVGASGAIFGMLAAFATLFPKRQLTLLIFFIFPVSMKAWQMVAGLAVIQYLLVTGGSSSNIAYTAHLAGGFAGFLYIDQLYESTLLRRGWKFLQSKVFNRSYKPHPAPPPPNQAEVDRILDKITDQGIGALTKHERKILHRASRTF